MRCGETGSKGVLYKFPDLSVVLGVTGTYKNLLQDLQDKENAAELL